MHQRIKSKKRAMKIKTQKSNTKQGDVRMKRMKPLLLFLCAVLLVGVSVLGTLAYFLRLPRFTEDAI